MGLVLKDTIVLETQQDVSQVQLLFGDITQLSLNEKVDYIFVSAFPGDYSPVPGTLIGALNRNLSLNVGTLAKNKEMDLRTGFNCWVSKPLPEEIPYKRLVCFERMNRNQDLPDQISSLFRAMMPVFNNQKTTVITPLLASGNQGNAEDWILKSIVTAACHWIQAGLPLQCLKIVIYHTKPDILSKENVVFLKLFENLKKEWKKRSKLEIDKQDKIYDVCLSYSKHDNNWAQKISTTLCEVNTRILIYADGFTYDHKEVWQESIFKTMIQSKKVVTVLTPNYLAESECLEQFNLALCCNRLTGVEVVVPFYVETIISFPSYMTVVQYTECRVRKEGEVLEEKILEACRLLNKQLKHGSKEKRLKAQANNASARDDKTFCDIFISYAHKSPEAAHKFYENTKKFKKLKVFFDKNVLETGNIWQESLYLAVSNARCVVAFISPGYLESAICQEEYNIALARYLSQDGIYLIPVVTNKDIQEIPVTVSGVSLLDMREQTVVDRHLSDLAHCVNKWLEMRDYSGIFSKPSNKFSVLQVLETGRQNKFNSHFTFKNGEIHPKKSLEHTGTNNNADMGKQQKTIVLSFAPDNLSSAAVLYKLLMSQKLLPVQCEFLVTKNKAGVQTTELTLLDTADMVVAVLSDDYMASPQHCQELHIALCRQRMVTESKVLYLIQANHSNLSPVYAHLLPHSINLNDKMWEEMGKMTSVKSATVLVKIPDTVEGSFTCTMSKYLALSAASLDILDHLAGGVGSVEGKIPINILNVLLLNQLGETSNIPLEKCLVPFSALKNENTIRPVSPVITEQKSEDEVESLSLALNKSAMLDNSKSDKPKREKSQVKKNNHHTGVCKLI